MCLLLAAAVLPPLPFLCRSYCPYSVAAATFVAVMYNVTGEALQMGCGKSDLIFWSGTFLWALSQCWLYSWSRELQHILLEAGGYFYVSFFAHLKEGPLRPGCWGFTPHHGLSSQGLSSLAANPMMLCGNFTLLSWSFLPTLLITVPMLPLTQ